MLFLQMNILAADKDGLLTAIDRAREEVAQTPSPEFFAMVSVDELPQFEIVSEETSAQDITETRR